MKIERDKGKGQQDSKDLGRPTFEGLQIPPSVDIEGITVGSMKFKTIRDRGFEVTPVTLTPSAFREEDLAGVFQLCIDRVNASDLSGINILLEETEDSGNQTYYIQRDGLNDVYVDFFAEDLFPMAVVEYRILGGIREKDKDLLGEVARTLDRESILDRFVRFNTEERRELALKRAFKRTEE